MSKIQSIKGVKQMYNRLVKNSVLTGYAGKSEEFKQVVKSEAQLQQLYESILLNGSASTMYTHLLGGIKGADAAERQAISRQFQAEIKKDIDTITKNSYMIRTNEVSKNQVYYNGKTVNEVFKQLHSFMSKPEFFNTLSSDNKRVLTGFLQLENDANADPETKEQNLKTKGQELINSELLPFIEKVTSDPKYQSYLELASRLANKQIDAKNLPTQLKELNLDISSNEVENIYKLTEFATGFKVKGEFDANKIKNEAAATDPSMVNSADKSAQLTELDIKTILMQTDKCNRPDLMLNPVMEDGQIYAQASNDKLKDAGISYEQAAKLIKSGIEEIQAGGKYEKLDPVIAPYVKFFIKSCPSIQFLPNIKMAEATSCRLGKSNQADKMYEPEAEAKKFLVEEPRFSKMNVEKIIEQVQKNVQMNDVLKDPSKLRTDVLARVMNGEIDYKFLTNEEAVAKYLLDEFYNNLTEEDKQKFITDKETYKAEGNTLLTVNDIKLLFNAFGQASEVDKQFSLFKISPKDFEVNKDGKMGKMAQKFGCSYEQFFTTLHKKYLEAVENEAIFTTGDDQYTPYIRYIMGYCRDITYAPSVGLTLNENAEEQIMPNVANAEEVGTPIMKNCEMSTYAKLVLALPSARNVEPIDFSVLFNQPSPETNEKSGTLQEQRAKLEAQLKEIDAKIEELQNKTKESGVVLPSGRDLAKLNLYNNAKRLIINNIKNIDKYLASVNTMLKQGIEEKEENKVEEQVDENANTPALNAQKAKRQMEPMLDVEAMSDAVAKYTQNSQKVNNDLDKLIDITTKNIDLASQIIDPEAYAQAKAEEEKKRKEQEEQNNQQNTEEKADEQKEEKLVDKVINKFEEKLEEKIEEKAQVNASKRALNDVEEIEEIDEDEQEKTQKEEKAKEPEEEMEEIEEIEEERALFDIRNIKGEERSNNKIDKLLKSTKYITLPENTELEEISEDDEMELEEIPQPTNNKQIAKKSARAMEEADENEYAYVYTHIPPQK